MKIETLKYFIQSANINILYGSGLSRPYLSVLGNIEKWLTELNEKRRIEGDCLEYTLVEASILKLYFENVMFPNVTPSGAEYDATIAEYRRFLLNWNELINKRNNHLIGKQINLFTTNIDVMMERAALGFGVELNDGFQGSIEQVFDSGCFQKTVRKTSLHFQNVSEVPVFNLLKIHGSINWREENDTIKNDIGLPTVLAVKKELDAIDRKIFIPTTKEDATGKTVDRTLNEMIDDAKDMKLDNINVLKPFLEQYKKLVMINPTKRKFKESVIDHHFYELMRQYSNNLEKENTLLIVSGFSFADEHIADITRRAANTNPTLHILIFVFCDSDGDTIKANMKLSDACINNNIEIITPSLFKKHNSQSQEEKYREYTNNVTKFDFATINNLFELISKSIMVYAQILPASAKLTNKIEEFNDRG